MIYSIALTLILGLGTCSQSGDWCPGHIGKIGLETELYKSGRHSFNGSAVHMSDYTDGTFLDNRRGDRGIETFMIEYKYEIPLKH